MKYFFLLLSLFQTQVSVCDLNDLLNQLSASDVDRLPIDSLMSCIAVLARKVPDPATRRKILDIFLMKKGGYVWLHSAQWFVHFNRYLAPIWLFLWPRLVQSSTELFLLLEIAAEQ